MAKKRRGDSSTRAIGAGLAGVVRALSLPFGKEMGARIVGHASHLVAPIVKVTTPRGTLRFWCPSARSAKRAVNFMRYEQDTRGWLEANVKRGDHLWDVGANMGAYTLYAHLEPGITVTSFEPVAGTYAALVRNISLNPFAKDTTALPVALSDETKVVTFYLRTTEVGGARHALGEPEAVDGRFEAEATQDVMALRGDDLTKAFGVRPPDHVKIDVDGHELRVLKGMTGLLPGVRTVWIEMAEAADASGENARVEAFLGSCGFALKEAGRNGFFVNSTPRPAS